MKKNIFKKLFIKISRLIGLELIDQNEFYSPTLEKNLDEKLSSKDKSIILPLGEVKLTKKINEKINEENEDNDFFSAVKLCKKKRIGPARNESNRPLFYKKDIAVLARAGFDFEVSRKVMDIDAEEYLKIINLL